MSLGTLYAGVKTRTTLPAGLVKHYGLDIKVVDPASDSSFAEKFPYKKVPAFEGADGFKLIESIAVDLHIASLSGKNDLVPTAKDAYASVVSWMSFANSEVFPHMFKSVAHLLPSSGAGYNKKEVDAAKVKFEAAVAIAESRLATHTYLVGERLSLADLYFVSTLLRGFQTTFDAEWRKAHPGVARLWNTVAHHPILKEHLGGIELLAEAKQYVPPKKEETKKEAKKEAKKPAAAAATDEPAPVQEKKPAHPLAALAPPKVAIDNWKRVYSNEDTREKAIPWFWENLETKDYSLWKVAYKYNDELTLTFMSNNLVGGFFNRLSASTKYMFGTAVVYGENNNNGIIGAFMIRGDDHVPAFDVAPDWESYEFTKLDPTNAEDKAFVDNMWAWDKPVVINGESREIADGKVFK